MYLFTPMLTAIGAASSRQTATERKFYPDLSDRSNGILDNHEEKPHASLTSYGTTPRQRTIRSCDYLMPTSQLLKSHSHTTLPCIVQNYIPSYQRVLSFSLQITW